MFQGIRILFTIQQDERTPGQPSVMIFIVYSHGLLLLVIRQCYINSKKSRVTTIQVLLYYSAYKRKQNLVWASRNQSAASKTVAFVLLCEFAYCLYQLHCCTTLISDYSAITVQSQDLS